VKIPNFIRNCPLPVLGALLLARSLGAADQPARLRFQLSFPATVRSEPADGRVFVIITRKADPEPRLQFGKSDQTSRP
jgi:hypothetical protein